MSESNCGKRNDGRHVATGRTTGGPRMPAQRLLQLQRLARAWADDFALGKIGLQRLVEPIDGGHVAVDEDHFFRRDVLEVRADGLARGMAAEGELLDVALQFLRWKFAVKGDFAPKRRAI